MFMVRVFESSWVLACCQCLPTIVTKRCDGYESMSNQELSVLTYWMVQRACGVCARVGLLVLRSLLRMCMSIVSTVAADRGVLLDTAVLHGAPEQSFMHVVFSSRTEAS